MKFLRVLSFIITIFAGITGTVQASLVEQDFVSGSGDRLITLDTETNLEWLDITVMRGKSYEQIRVDEFVTNNGFRYATPSEFFQLTRNFNMTTSEWSTANSAGARNFMEMLGSTGINGPYSNGSYVQRAEGFVQMYEGHNSATLGVVKFIYNADTETYKGKAYQFMNHSPNGHDSIGAYLVRNSSVPIPGAVWLLGTGIAGLAGIRRKRIIL